MKRSKIEEDERRKKRIECEKNERRIEESDKDELKREGMREIKNKKW